MFYQEINHMTRNGCKQTLADFVYRAHTSSALDFSSFKGFTSIRFSENSHLEVLLSVGRLHYISPSNFRLLLLLLSLQ